jgi:uncharacterized membrane protein
MESKVTICGHPVHPMLIALPLGLTPAALVADLVHHLTNDPVWGRFSFWLMFGGVLSGSAAGVIGLLDWKGLPVGTKERGLGAVHGVTNLATMSIFVLSLVLRSRDPGHPSAAAKAVGLIGGILASVGGWLGGELVFRLGVGVHEPYASESPRRRG